MDKSLGRTADTIDPPVDRRPPGAGAASGASPVAGCDELDRETTERSKSEIAMQARPLASCAPRSSAYTVAVRIALFLVTLYLFFLSIELMGAAFKGLGSGFAARLMQAAADPIAGLLIGLLVTSFVQSSSFTTSLTIGLVAAGTIPLRLSIPIIMGANIGTTVTNTIVSMGHVARPKEFRQAFAAGTVHDFFNVLAVIVLLPIELLAHPIERTAVVLERAFEGFGGIELVSPLKVILGPATTLIGNLVPHHLVLLVLSLGLLFLALTQMVRLMRKMIMKRVEALFDRVMFRNDATGFLLGWLLTTLVQSSSVTTSLIVPLVGTGMLTVPRIYPYTLGANLGTTITAILASFSTGHPVAITVAFTHLLFNIFGICIFYPLRALPIRLAMAAGDIASRSARNATLAIVIYVAAHVIPILYVLRCVLRGG